MMKNEKIEPLTDKDKLNSLRRMLHYLLLEKKNKIEDYINQMERDYLIKIFELEKNIKKLESIIFLKENYPTLFKQDSSEESLNVSELPHLNP